MATTVGKKENLWGLCGELGGKFVYFCLSQREVNFVEELTELTVEALRAKLSSYYFCFINVDNAIENIVELLERRGLKLKESDGSLLVP